MDESFVTTASNARDDLVSDHCRLIAEVDTYRLAG
jgi:hypothetical protein